MKTEGIRRGKAILLKDQLSMGSSFVTSRHTITDDSPWHFHPEIELVYCVTGTGTSFVGNSVSPVAAGDLLLIGKNLAHTRAADKTNEAEVFQEVAIKFREDFLGKDFFLIPEFNHIDTLLQNAQRGIHFYGETARILGHRISHMEQTGIKGLLDIVSMLDVLGRTEELNFLNTIDFLNDANSYDLQKINKVFEYTADHFREQIMLADVAALVNLTEAGFCRYFKARTRKSYFQYLTEVRIANACRLLQEEDLDVSQACYSSGFNNPSHFHKQFKKIVALTPKEYRRKTQERSPVYR